MCIAIFVFMLAIASIQLIEAASHQNTEEHQPRYAQLRQVQSRSLANLNMLQIKDVGKSVYAIFDDNAIFDDYAEFDKNNALFQIKN